MSAHRAHRLFVYGTLRRDGPAAHLLEGCTWVGAAELPGTLYDVLGRYPALVLDHGGNVHGELWEIDPARLQALDRYEGVEEGLFRRVAARIAQRDCWVYEAGPALQVLLRPERRLPDGRWPAG